MGSRTLGRAINKPRGKIGDLQMGWICRHMLARVVAALRNTDCDFGIFHTCVIPNPPVVGQPNPVEVCNVGATQKIPGADLRADVRAPTARL